MRRMTLLFGLVLVLLATPFPCFGLREGGDAWERIPTGSGRQSVPIPDERLQEGIIGGPGEDHLGERRGLGGGSHEVSSPLNSVLRPTGNLGLARRDLEKNGEVFAALAKFGANPSPFGVARILDLMQRYPVEFWGLADRAGEAARRGDPDAMERLWQAVWILREAKVLEDGDWDDLAYVLARVNQGEGSGAEPKGKGDPIFHRPFGATKGALPPTGGGQGGGGSGDGMGGWFGGRWDSEGPIGEIGPVTDPKKWGKGKGGMGNGIMGWSDGEKGPPKGSRWVPPVDVGVRPDFQGPKTMGPDGGFYGGIDIGMLPGQAGKGGRPDGWGHKQHAETVFAMAREYKKKADSSFGTESAMYRALQYACDLWAVAGENADSGIYFDDLGDEGGWESVIVLGKSFLYNNEQGIYLEFGGNSGSMPRPDGEEDRSPRNDPQLLIQLTKAADRQQNKPDVVPGVVDPVPIRGNDAAGRAGGGELAAAGAAKAEAAWKFSGKKPGSEVTDPAEWQTFHGEETSGIAKDVSLITDPAEPTAGMAAMGDRSSGLSEQGKALFAQFMGQFLVQSIQAVGGTP